MSETIYLSGGMENAVALGSSWRLSTSTILASLGYTALNITALDNAFSEQFGCPLAMADTDELSVKAVMRKQYIEDDLRLIRNDSDAVLIYYDESVRRGAGSHSEVHHAFENNIPVFLVTSYDTIIGNVPKWMIAMCTATFTSFDEFYSYISNLPNGILKKDRYDNHGLNGKYLCSMCGDVFNGKFVSKISPLQCTSCDKIVEKINNFPDRYTFFKTKF